VPVAVSTACLSLLVNNVYIPFIQELPSCFRLIHQHPPVHRAVLCIFANDFSFTYCHSNFCIYVDSRSLEPQFSAIREQRISTTKQVSSSEQTEQIWNLIQPYHIFEKSSSQYSSLTIVYSQYTLIYNTMSFDNGQGGPARQHPPNPYRGDPNCGLWPAPNQNQNAPPAPSQGPFNGSGYTNNNHTYNDTSTTNHQYFYHRGPVMDNAQPGMGQNTDGQDGHVMGQNNRAPPPYDYPQYTIQAENDGGDQYGGDGSAHDKSSFASGNYQGNGVDEQNGSADPPIDPRLLIQARTFGGGSVNPIVYNVQTPLAPGFNGSQNNGFPHVIGNANPGASSSASGQNIGFPQMIGTANPGASSSAGGQNNGFPQVIGNTNNGASSSASGQNNASLPVRANSVQLKQSYGSFDAFIVRQLQKHRAQVRVPKPFDSSIPVSTNDLERHVRQLYDAVTYIGNDTRGTQAANKLEKVMDDSVGKDNIETACWETMVSQCLSIFVTTN
jgi:hypothetical protein